MIIKLYDIEEGVSVKGTLDGSKLKRPEDRELSFLSPVEYELSLQMAGENVWIRGPVRASLSLTCSRCLEEFTFSIESRLDIELMSREKAPGAPEVELATEELNLSYFEGDEIDLDPYVFEEVMLNLPIKALCSEACRGICPSCGKNLNLEECRCERTETSVLGEKLNAFLKER